ncbi:hypothetical protein D3C85_955360 [compost metagenome]
MESTPAKSEVEEELHTDDLSAPILSTMAIRTGVLEVKPEKLLVKSLIATKKS